VDNRKSGLILLEFGSNKVLLGPTSKHDPTWLDYNIVVPKGINYMPQYVEDDLLSEFISMHDGREPSSFIFTGAPQAPANKSRYGF